MRAKLLIVFIVCVIGTIILNFNKNLRVIYLPFNIPGKQMAATLPPFGIFIESRLKGENRSNPCSVYNHEKVHWEQYKRMGLISFYYNYLKLYFRFGRFNNWMEVEAREGCTNKYVTYLSPMMVSNDRKHSYNNG